MSDGINIDITANADEVVAAAGDVDKAFDKVKDSLDDLAKASEKSSDKAGDKLADGIEDGTKKADADLEKLERSFKDLSDDAGRAGDDIGTGVTRGTKKATEGVKEIGDESASTAKEAAASFDGSAESIGDAFQEVAANAFAGFGPAGLIAGVAAAAGIGLITSAIEGAGDQSDAFKEETADLATQLIESGRNGTIAIEDLSDKLKELAVDSEDAGKKFDELQKDAGRAGTSFEDLAGSYGLSAKELKGLKKEMQEAQDEVSKLEDAESKSSGTTSKATLALRDKRLAYEDIKLSLDGQIKLQQEAEKSERQWIEAGGPALATKAAAIETYQDSIDDAVGSFDDFKNAETEALDPAAYIASIQARIDATGNFNANIQTLATQFKLSDEEIQYLLDQGLDFAPMLQSIIDSGLAPNFVDQIHNAVGGGQDVLNGADLNATVTVGADEKPANETLRTLMEKDRPAKPMTVTADTTKAEQQTQAAAAKTYSSTIKVGADVGSAQSAIDSFISRNSGRRIPMVADVRDRNGKPVL